MKTTIHEARAGWKPSEVQRYQTFPDLPGTEIYFYEHGGRPAVLGFSGRCRKPDLWLHFPDANARDKRVAAWIKGQRDKVQKRAAARAERKAFRTSLKVGDVLSSSWGYDQTNVDFYQVVEVTASGKSVSLRPIGKRTVKEGGFMCDYVVASRDDFTGKARRHRVGLHDAVRIDSCSIATPWDGKPAYRSWYA